MGKNTVIIDVAEAARNIGASPQARAGAVSAPVHAAGARGAGPACVLGHPNTPQARFCAECGLPMDAPPPVAPLPAEVPKPAGQLTPEERAARDRQHSEAVAANMRADDLVPDISAQADPSPEKITIHFVEDGFTWAGRVWYRGDELTIGPEHPRWPTAVPWITLTKQEQATRYGRVKFDSGPWPYAPLPPGAEVPLPSAGHEQVFAARRRGVPARAGEDGALVPL